MNLKQKQTNAEPSYPDSKQFRLNRRYFLSSTGHKVLSIIASLVLHGCKKQNNKKTSAQRSPKVNVNRSTESLASQDSIRFGGGIGEPNLPDHYYFQPKRAFTGFNEWYRKGNNLYAEKRYREARKVWQALLDQHYHELEKPQYNALVSSLKKVNNIILHQNQN